MFRKSLFAFVLATFFTFSFILNAMEIKERIIAGKTATLGQFPWTVILKKPNSEDSACGASLISKNWVLTAAHCVNRATELVLMFGSIKLVNHDVPNMTSTDLHTYPGYNTGDLKRDLGLIKLPKPIKLIKYIKTIRLPPISWETNHTFVGKKAVTAGYGLNDDTTYKYPNDLWYTHVKIISNEDCKKGLRFIKPIPNGTECALGDGKTNASICQGDSGSALAIKRKGKYMQIGVTSFSAEGLCEKGYPVGFARITEYLEWIKNVTGLSWK